MPPIHKAVDHGIAESTAYADIVHRQGHQYFAGKLLTLSVCVMSNRPS
jgi:hypothetical protein